MSNSIPQTLVPENKEGKAVDIEQTITEESLQEAITMFRLAYSRLIYPAIWKNLAGAGTASFSIWRAGSHEVQRHVQVNDYLRIDIPGPGPSAGDGYDWVRVETLQENIIPHTDESFVMRLRACANPENPDSGTAHFFSEEATSTFILKRVGMTVTFSYHGRNEKPNTSEVETVDKIRNKLVATGAVAGLSEVQWTALLKGILQKEK
jgi:hypothetical protein